MKRIFRYFSGCLTVCLCLTTACEKPEPYRVTADSGVFMRFTTAVVDGASVVPALGGALKSLDPQTFGREVRAFRVVIVSKDDADGSWTVETNEFYRVGPDGDPLPDELIYAIEDARAKKVFLFANCDSLEIKDAAGQVVSLDDHGLFKPGADGRTPVEDCRFIAPRGRDADSVRYVPMTAVYDITVPPKEALRRVGEVCYFDVEKPLYLVRAFTKFSLEFVNLTSERVSTNIQLGNFTISKIATGESYLFAHVADDWKNATMTAGTYNTWQEWLVAEAGRTQSADADPEKYEYLTAYELPDGVGYEDCRYVYRNPSSTSNVLYATGNSTTLTGLKPVYFPESKYNPDADGLQQYHVSVRVYEWEPQRGYTTGRYVTYEADLPYCQSLFRNTEVRVRVTFKGDAIALDAVVCPWTRHEIEIPPFE